jgi:uncharacterized protein YcnI
MIRKTLVATLLFGFALVALPAIAGAHTEIKTEGSLSADGTIATTINVEEECPTPGTVKDELVFPSSPALTNVTAAPVPGWTAQVDKNPTTGAVSKITWTGAPAAGTTEIVFPVTMGTIPASTESIVFTSVQTCADGSVIRWVEPIPPGGAEPEHPTPVLELKSSSSDTSSTTNVPVTTKSSSDDSNTGLIIGVAVGAVALIAIGVVIYRRNK